MAEENSNIQRHPGWRNALHLFEEADFAYGHVLTDEWLAEAFSLPPKHVAETWSVADYRKWELRFLQQFKRFERELADRLSLCVERVQGTGYRVMHPRTHARRSMERLHHEHIKAQRRARRTLAATRLQELTPHERMEVANAMSLVARSGAASPQPREWRAVGASNNQGLAIMADGRKLHE